jgi:hypothetical protein
MKLRRLKDTNQDILDAESENDMQVLARLRRYFYPELPARKDVIDVTSLSIPGESEGVAPEMGSDH